MLHRLVGFLTAVLVAGVAVATPATAASAPVSPRNQVDPVTPNRPVIAVAVGDDFTCSIVKDTKRHLRCWGDHAHGQLGNGALKWEEETDVWNTETFLPTTVAVMDTKPPVNGVFTPANLEWARQHPEEALAGTTDFTAALGLAAGRRHACGIHNNRTVSCWGDNRHHQLGMSMSGAAQVPYAIAAVQVKSNGAALADVASLALGARHSCALLRTGAVTCWGSNDQGQLGHCSSNRGDSGPVLVLLKDPVTRTCGPLPRVTAIFAGAFHTCAILATKQAACWGDNKHGQISPAKAAGGDVFGAWPVQRRNGAVLTEVSTGAASTYQTCMSFKAAVKTDPNVKCWGTNPHPHMTPIGGYVDWGSLSLGDNHACAIEGFQADPTKVVGGLSCWGANSSGELGDGKGASTAEPQAVETRDAKGDIGGFPNAAATAVGRRHSCAITESELLYCWGANDHGQLGIGATMPAVYVAIRVANLGNEENYDD